VWDHFDVKFHDENFKLIIPSGRKRFAIVLTNEPTGLFRVVLSIRERQQWTGPALSPIANQSTADMISDRSTNLTPRHVAFVTSEARPRRSAHGPLETFRTSLQSLPRDAAVNPSTHITRQGHKKKTLLNCTDCLLCLVDRRCSVASSSRHDVSAVVATY
jgi:hypothetical protein